MNLQHGKGLAISLRPIRDDDAEILSRIYASTRTDIDGLPWPDEQKSVFCHGQFEAQHNHYIQHFANAKFDLILLDGDPVGRLYVERNEMEIRVIDIAILPEQRGNGIGTTLMNQIIEEASHDEKPVRLRVQAISPARRWYQNLGFVLIADEQINWHMERQTSSNGKLNDRVDNQCQADNEPPDC